LFQHPSTFHLPLFRLFLSLGLLPCDECHLCEAAKLLLALPELDNLSVYREWVASNFSLEAFIGSVRKAVLADVRTV
jgi:hypothetical protein